MCKIEKHLRDRTAVAAYNRLMTVSFRSRSYYESNESLAASLGCCVATARRVISVLRKTGWIVLQRRRHNAPSIWRPLFHDEWLAAHPDAVCGVARAARKDVQHESVSGVVEAEYVDAAPHDFPAVLSVVEGEYVDAPEYAAAPPEDTPATTTALAVVAPTALATQHDPAAQWLAELAADWAARRKKVEESRYEDFGGDAEHDAFLNALCARPPLPAFDPPPEIRSCPDDATIQNMWGGIVLATNRYVSFNHKEKQTLIPVIRDYGTEAFQAAVLKAFEDKQEEGSPSFTKLDFVNGDPRDLTAAAAHSLAERRRSLYHGDLLSKLLREQNALLEAGVVARERRELQLLAEFASPDFEV
jgi:hypothetical protein